VVTATGDVARAAINASRVMRLLIDSLLGIGST
jgi:hypothetical protein